MKLREYDQVRTREGTVWVVHGVVGERFVCRPKYVPDALCGRIRIGPVVYARLHSPLFVRLPRRYDRLLRPYEQYRLASNVPTNFHLVGAGDILEVKSATMTPPDGGTLVARSALDLCNRIMRCCAIPQYALGVTGSVALGIDMAGVSDIDVVIYGNYFYRRFRRHIHSLERFGLRLRDERDWERFFTTHAVQSSHTRGTIMQRTLARYDQGLYRGIPHTIFVARPELRRFRETQERLDRMSFAGRVIDAEEAYYYPAVLKLTGSAGPRTVESYDRVDQWGFPHGGRVIADGLSDGRTLVVLPGKGSLRELPPT